MAMSYLQSQRREFTIESYFTIRKQTDILTVLAWMDFLLIATKCLKPWGDIINFAHVQNTRVRLSKINAETNQKKTTWWIKKLLAKQKKKIWLSSGSVAGGKVLKKKKMSEITEKMRYLYTTYEARAAFSQKEMGKRLDMYSAILRSEF